VFSWSIYGAPGLAFLYPGFFYNLTTAVFLLLSSTGFTVYFFNHLHRHYFLRLRTSLSTRVPYLPDFFVSRTIFYFLQSTFTSLYRLCIMDWKTVYFVCCYLYSRRYFIRPSVSTKPLLMNCYFTGFLHFTDSPSFIFILPATSVT
jgi:hypothetical protein